MIQQQLNIGNDVFIVAILSARKSWGLQPRIMPAAAEIFGVIGSMKKLGDLDIAAAVPVVSKVFSMLPPEELNALLEELLAGATMNGKVLFIPGSPAQPFDILMRGRTMDTWKLLYHAIRVNYPDFFGLLGVKSDKAEEQKSHSPSPA